MSRNVIVAGVGMIPFAKPGGGDTYDVMASRATSEALADARIAYGEVQQAFAGYVYGDSTAGQKALYRVGMTGIPVVNVNNNCSTGSTALFLARQLVGSGAVDCALAVGFEQMAPGALTAKFNDRPTPFDDFDRETDALVGHPEIPLAIRYFGGAGLAHMQKYGTSIETFAQVRFTGTVKPAPRRTPSSRANDADRRTPPCGGLRTSAGPGNRGSGRSHGRRCQGRQGCRSLPGPLIHYSRRYIGSCPVPLPGLQKRKISHHTASQKRACQGAGRSSFGPNN